MYQVFNIGVNNSIFAINKGESSTPLAGTKHLTVMATKVTKKAAPKAAAKKAAPKAAAKKAAPKKAVKKAAPKKAAPKKAAPKKAVAAKAKPKAKK